MHEIAGRQRTAGALLLPAKSAGQCPHEASVGWGSMKLLPRPAVLGWRLQNKLLGLKAEDQTPDHRGALTTTESSLASSPLLAAMRLGFLLGNVGSDSWRGCCEHGLS